MLKRAKKLIQRSTILRYGINGVFATAIHYACLTLALRVLAFPSAGIANFCAALVGISVSFLGSRYFVFRVFSETLLQQLGRFVGLYGLIAVLHAILLFFWTDLMRLNYNLGFAFGIVLQVVISYFGNRHIVFRDRGKFDAARYQYTS